MKKLIQTLGLVGALGLAGMCTSENGLAAQPISHRFGPAGYIHRNFPTNNAIEISQYPIEINKLQTFGLVALFMGPLVYLMAQKNNIR